MSRSALARAAAQQEAPRVSAPTPPRVRVIVLPSEAVSTLQLVGAGRGEAVAAGAWLLEQPTVARLLELAMVEASGGDGCVS